MKDVHDARVLIEGLECEHCGSLVYDSPSGRVCAEGHGGIEGQPVNNQNKLVMIIDCAGICHAARFKMGNLAMYIQKGSRSQNKLYTGVIFGFLRKILTLFESMNPDYVVFAWDSNPKESLRLEMYDEYKANRDKDEDRTEEERIAYRATIDQMVTLRETILPGMGFKNNYYVQGYEADDIFGKIVRAYPAQRMVMVTRDHDMYQLLTDNVVMYDPVGKSVLTATDFEKMHGIIPRDWPLVKAIAGCVTDNVKGVFGVAEKTAIKFLKRELGENTKAYKAIKENEDIVMRNMDLVYIPFDDIRDFEILPVVAFNIGYYCKTCAELGMRTMVDQKTVSRWENVFERFTRTNLEVIKNG